MATTTRRPGALTRHSRTVLWAAYAAFVVAVVAMDWHEGVLDLGGPLAWARAGVWLAWASFLVFTVRASFRENMFRSLATMWRLQWGRQVGIDLYIGLAVALLVIGVHGGAATALVWLLPIIVYANLATLVYVGIHFDSLVAALGA